MNYLIEFYGQNIQKNFKFDTFMPYLRPFDAIYIPDYHQI